MLWTIVVIAICTLICAWSAYFSHMALLNRPIFIGFVVGILMGDMTTGILVGAQLELAFLGVVSIGATAAADPAVATIITTAISIRNGLPMETVIPIGMTIGYVAAFLANVKYVVGELFIPAADTALKNDQEKKFNLISVGGTLLLTWVYPFIVCTAGILLGGDLLEQFINALPAFILTGIGAAGAMLPALGVASILVMILNKRTAIYFMAGFVIYKYLNVDMVFMLVIGLLLAITDFVVSSELAKKRPAAAGISEEISEEEAFLS